tara:strand:- start:586 stop:1578 length:993 start_codon:yes stop_codon:yes gene_type:complete
MSHPKSLQIYKGTYYSGKYNLPWVKEPPKKVTYKLPEKVVVFDLDETLGSFGDLYILWSGVKHIHKNFEQFDKLLDLYPEFFRYGIMTILEFLYEKKKTKECSKIFLYTNNRCSKEWVQYICKYFQTKIHETQKKGDILIPLFNKLICAFKINNQKIEKCRTTHRKTYTDLVRCAMLSQDTEICFIDDLVHEDMKHSRVYYICPTPYYHTLTGKEIIERFCETKWFIKKKSPLLHNKRFWKSWFQSQGRGLSYETKVKNMKQDMIVSQKMMYYIKEFLTWGNPPFYRSKKKPISKKKKLKHDGATVTKKKRTKITSSKSDKMKSIKHLHG